YTDRLAGGSGVAETEKMVLEPSTMPAMASPSTNDGAEPPHGPDEPSTRTQSDAEPVADSSAPAGPTTATRPAAYPGPFMGRAPRSAISPITSDSSTGAPASSVEIAEGDVRTSRKRTGVVLSGIDHVSVNCTRPSLLYVTE